MAKKKDGVDIGNKEQFKKIMGKAPPGMEEALMRVFNIFGELQEKEGSLVLLVAAMSSLDGEEMTDQSRLAEMVKDWHKRAYLGLRSFEAN